MTRRQTMTETELQRSWSDDPARVAFVGQLNQAVLRQSPTLQRVVKLAAALAGSSFAQISLISDVQHVPAAYGIADIDAVQGTALDDSLCAVALASGTSLVVHDARKHPWLRDLEPVASGAVGSYLGVPMRHSDGTLVGVLCVFDVKPSDWAADLAGSLEELVSFAMTEIELLAAVAATSSSVVELTSLIQRIVAPASLASPEGTQIRGRYRSAEVGGDWFEWLSIGGGLAITIGDVAGHGLRAVAGMARLKAIMRAYVFEGQEPAAAIGLAGGAFPVDDDFDFATVLDIRFEPTRRALSYASAGHPPPLILRRSGSFFAPLRPGPPIGAGWSGFANHSLSLLDGDVVLVYTDGLFERRRQDADDALELLRSAAHEAFLTSTSLGELADTLIDLGLSDTADDACLVVLAT